MFFFCFFLFLFFFFSFLSLCFAMMISKLFKYFLKSPFHQRFQVLFIRKMPSSTPLSFLQKKCSNLITLVRQGYKIHNQFSESCYWLVIGSIVQRFKACLIQLRTGCTSWTKTFPAPCAKQEWLLLFFSAKKSCRQKQIQFVGNLSKMIK